MEKRRGHVIVLTYPAQGHINPLFQFAKRLASKGLKATLGTTPYTIKYIHAGIVGVEPISDGFDQGGFTQAPSLDAYLESFRTVGPKTLKELILKFDDTESPVNCIVYDTLLPWALDVAKEFGIYSAAFYTASASFCALHWQLQNGVLNEPGVPLLDNASQSPTPDSAYIALLLEKWSSLDDDDWVFVNTFVELESEVTVIPLFLELSGSSNLYM